MRFLVVVLAVCAGCANSLIGIDESEMQHQRTLEGGPPQLQEQEEQNSLSGEEFQRTREDNVLEGFGAGRLLSARIAISAAIGSAQGPTEMAVDKFRHTEFGRAPIMELGAMYVLPSESGAMNSRFIPRYGFEMRFNECNLQLTDRSRDFGDLDLKTAVVAFRFLEMPGRGRVFGFHLDAGFGVGESSFDKGAALDADDLLYGVYTRVRTGQASVIALGAGVDFYTHYGLCFSLDYRYAGAYIPVDWQESGIKRSDIDYLNASTHQLLLTLRYFF